MPLGPTPSLNVHTHTIMEQDAVCRTQNGGRHMLGFVFDNVGVVLHTTYARRSQLHNAGLLVLILSNHTWLMQELQSITLGITFPYREIDQKKFTFIKGYMRCFGGIGHYYTPWHAGQWLAIQEHKKGTASLVNQLPLVWLFFFFASIS